MSADTKTQKKPMGPLDRWEALNVEMDTIAKRALQSNIQKPNGYSWTPSWSISINDSRLVKHIEKRLYRHVHGREATTYWAQKGRITNTSKTFMPWENIRNMMSRIPNHRKWFLTKHTAGMCGVGKFLVRWKESDRPDCPRCGEYEDARHVWICKSEEATYVWDNRMDKLFSWLTMIDTDPEIFSAILTGLKTWGPHATRGVYRRHGLHHLPRRNRLG
jgi:hypothetical protein